MKIMNKSNKKSDSMPVIIAIILFIVTVVSFVIWGVKSETEYVETKYNLFELNDGVYATYYTTHSTAPAYNYEVVTLNCDGNIYTFQGHVQITYTDDKPYVIHQKRNIVNADRMYVYVPSGSVEFQGSVMVK